MHFYISCYFQPFEGGYAFSVWSNLVEVITMHRGKMPRGLERYHEKVIKTSFVFIVFNPLTLPLGISTLWHNVILFCKMIRMCRSFYSLKHDKKCNTTRFRVYDILHFDCM